jgi:hypothetical protein
MLANNLSKRMKIYPQLKYFFLKLLGYKILEIMSIVVMKESQCFQIFPSSLFCTGYVIFEQNYGSMSMLPNTRSMERSHLGKCQAMTTSSQIPLNTPFIIILSPLIQNNI